MKPQKNSKLFLLKDLKKPNFNLDKNNRELSYGSLEIIKEKAGIEKSKAEYVHTPHSIWTCWPKDLIKKTEMWNPGYTVLIVHNKWDKKILQKLLPPPKKIVTTPHSFYFLQEKFGITKKALKKGTVIFYPHGLCRQAPPSLPMKKLILYIKTLPKKLYPITVCFHFSDWNDKKNKLLKKNKVLPVCAGHINDKFFLHKLYLLLDQSKNIISFDHGTQIFLAFICNCKVILERKVKVLNFIPSSNFINYDQIKPAPHFQVFFEMLKNNQDQKLISNYVHKLLGKNKLPSSKKLKKIFYEAEKNAYRWKTKNKNIFPPFILRFFYLKIYLKIRALKNQFALWLLARPGYYVNSSYMINEILAYEEKK